MTPDVSQLGVGNRQLSRLPSNRTRPSRIHSGDTKIGDSPPLIAERGKGALDQYKFFLRTGVLK